MRVLWASRAWDQYIGWQHADPSEVWKINDLIENIRRDPFRGIGQPEPLKAVLQGWWSRRINREDRLVYRVAGKDDLKTRRNCPVQISLLIKIRAGAAAARFRAFIPTGLSLPHQSTDQPYERVENWCPSF